MTEPLLKMAGIGKAFPGVRALDGVDLEVMPGEIHALLGENGAGKSTLLKILSGAQQPDAGTIAFGGRKVAPATPHDAQALGIVTIYQEFTLAPNMSIAENVFIGREPGIGVFVNWQKMIAETRAITQRLGLELRPTAIVRDLNVAEQQMVEIARALSMKSRLIVMDEPTSALSSSEVDKLFRIIRDLKAQGLSIIFVTHRLEEVMELCDRFTVLRDGEQVGSGAVTDTTIDQIIRLMVGRQVSTLFARRAVAAAGDIALRVEGLSRQGNTQDQNATVLDDVGFEVRKGEILGIAGLVGAGRTEAVRAIFGADAFDAGRIFIDGTEVHIKSPQSAIRHGIGLVPEDRKQQALFLSLAVRTNLSIAAHDRISRWGVFIDDAAERALVDEYRKTLNIRMAGQGQLIANLSGGNQQKVVLARWLALGPKILIVDEPTRGIDVGAKVEVHNLLFEMARKDIAIIAISSELPEILAISDRIVAMREGRVTGTINRDQATEERLMAMMTLSATAAYSADSGGTTMDGTRPAAAGDANKLDVIGFVARFAPLIFLLVLMAVFAVVEPRFLTPLNLFNVLRQVSIYGLLAVGMTFVILTAGIDLSIGSLVAFCGLVAAAVSKGGLANRFTVGAAQDASSYAWYVAAAAAVLVGLAGGYLQGFAITRLKVPPFVVTLGGMSAFRGAALLFASGGPISGFEPQFVWWGQGKIGAVPVPVIVFIGFAIIAHLALRYTRYGRQVYAVGGNPEAARLSGLNVRAVVTSVYVIMGFFAGLGSFVLAARLNAAEAVAGTGYELTVIASVVIGGTSLFGGVGSIFGTVIGTILIGVLLNGLVLVDVSAYIQQIIIGVIIVLAVAFDTFAKSRKRLN